MNTPLALLRRLLLLGCALASAAFTWPGGITEEVIYTVQSGDTLSGLAQRFGVPKELIAERNKLPGHSSLRAGTGLFVPAGPRTQGLPRYRPPLPVGKPLTPCAVKRWPAPTPAEVSGCARAGCTQSPTGARVCACLAQEQEGQEPEDLLFLEEAGARRKVSSQLPLFGSVEDFEVLDVDMDGNGSPERVVAVHFASSNGLGVESWDLHIVEPQRSPHTTLRIAEYGEGSLLRRADGRGCDVLQTDWKDLQDPLKGSGLYFVGRRLEYRDGALRPTSEPIRARRYLREFREAGGPQQPSPRFGQPARWLSQGWAEGWPTDPFIPEAPAP
ncbi:MAG TPA: LysM domain-containing protein [Myxococcaceae bacterium]